MYSGPATGYVSPRSPVRQSPGPFAQPIAGGQPIKVVVIGGGLAGLSCARELAIRGVDVTVLEASTRVGGRTLCDADGTDLGAAYVGCTQRRILRVCERYGLGLVDVNMNGKTTQVLRGVVQHYAGMIPPVSPLGALELNDALVQIEKICDTIDPSHPEKHVDAHRLDHMSMDEYLKKVCPLSTDARAVLHTGVKTLVCLEACEVSVLAFCWYMATSGGPKRAFEVKDGLQECKIRGGAGRVAPLIAREIESCGPHARVLYECPVRHVDYSQVVASPLTGIIQVHTDRGDFAATHVAICIPPIQRARITFNPARSVQEQAALVRWPMGHIIKTFVYYSEPFWREKNLNGSVVCDKGVAVVTYDDTKDDGSLPAIMGFVTSSDAAETYHCTPEERFKRITEHYAAIFKDPRALQPLRYKEKVWAQEPWIGGCYTGVPTPGTLTMYPRRLITQQPCDRVFMGGTECAATSVGYMDGAIASGEAIAATILSRAGLLRGSEADTLLNPSPSRLMRERPLRSTRLERALPSSKMVAGVAAMLACAVVYWLSSWFR